MGRILLLLLIALLLVLVVRSFIRSRQKPVPPPATTAQGEDMVTCSRCGVNLPRSETIELDGKRICRENPHCKATP